jgi:hypothetical protein
MSSGTGQIELTTAAATNTGINIENTNATSGGITLKTGGTTGNIVLQSANTIVLQDSTPTIHYTQSSTSTTLTNATINLQDNTPTTRFSQTSTTTTITNTNTGVVGNFTASRIFVGTIASNTPLLSFQLSGVKSGTATSGSVLFQPSYDNTTGLNDMTNFQVPFPIRILKYVLMFDNDSGVNTSLTLSFYFKTGNAGTRTFDYTETITTIVSSARSNSQSGSINGTAGLDYTSEIISIDYAASPANEWALILYAQQRG